MSAEMEIPQIAKILMPKLAARLRYNDTTIPLGFATRSVRGPILFKCCRVQFNKNSGKLEIHDGEYIGKCRGENTECYEAVIDLETDETDLPG